jgi:hypothetical protein
VSKLYYYPYTPYDTGERIEEHPLFDLLYPLTPYDPPHKTDKQLLVNQCPAMQAFDNQSFIIKSPVDIRLDYDTFAKKLTTNAPEGTRSLILTEQPDSPIIQLAFYYLFWQDKPSDTQLFLYDPPLYSLKSLPNFYITAGMIPIGQYTRNSSIGIIIKDKTKPVIIKRGQPLATITTLSSKKIQLKKTPPPQHILDTNARNLKMKKFCPYTFSKQLFSRWL